MSISELSSLSHFQDGIYWDDKNLRLAQADSYSEMRNTLNLARNIWGTGRVCSPGLNCSSIILVLGFILVHGLID